MPVSRQTSGPPAIFQVLDEVEAVEFGFATCQLGQIPPLWGCRSTLATHGIERTAPLQHAIDRGTRNDYGLFDGRQRIGDRLPAELSQHAVLAQVRTRSKNLRFLARRRPIPRSSRLTIAEIDPRKGLASRMLNPVAPLCRRSPKNASQPRAWLHRGVLLVPSPTDARPRSFFAMISLHQITGSYLSCSANAETQVFSQR